MWCADFLALTLDPKGDAHERLPSRLGRRLDGWRRNWARTSDWNKNLASTRSSKESHIPCGSHWSCVSSCCPNRHAALRNLICPPYNRSSFCTREDCGIGNRGSQKPHTPRPGPDRVGIFDRGRCHRRNEASTQGRSPAVRESEHYFNLEYSALAAMRMGISGSASFHSLRKS
jgi:hypothetical protein